MSQRNVSSKSTKLVFAFQIVVCSLFRSLSALTYLIALALSLLVFCQNAHPAQITMAWDPNNEPDLAGYKVYYGSSSTNYEVFADVGNQTTCTLSDLEEGQTIYLAATAYDVTGNESDYSEELTYYVPKVNTPPIASSSTLTTMQDTIVTGTLSTSDPDGDPLTFSLITTGGIGTATLTNATAGVFTYAPNPNATGIDTFTFKANDGTADSNTAEVTITITPPRDTDGDGISDEDETDLYGTDPNKVDTDEDGLADGDGSLDGIKIDQGSDPADPSSRPELPSLEIGEVSVDHTWSRVEFNRSFMNPIVVAKPLSLNDDAPAVVRVCNVDETGFEIRIQEWDYLDGTHAVETVSYLVMERGGYTLADGIRVEAGTFETSTTSSFGAVSFSQSFEKVPVVITAVSSFNETNAITGRLRNITPQGFEFRRQGQELTPGVYGTQTISYIAWEPSSGMLGGLTFEVNSTDDVVRHDFHTILFDQPFVSIPLFLADMQTTDGGDTANLRWQGKDLYGVNVLIDEEQSKDRETNHTTEVVGYMAFAQMELNIDTDEDGLKNGDELHTYGTDPSRADSDSDSIDDGDELAFWSNDWDVDYDGDGLINLLDPDADGDGYPDGIECNEGFDPADFGSRPELPPLEIGEVSVDHNWRRVAFNRSFMNPIVVAKPLSLNDDAPAVVRVCNVDETGFEIRIQEWDYLDGTHAVETVSYLVMERGGYTLADGIRVEAGTFETSTTSSFGAVSFSQSFEKVPVVITAVSSFNETNAITGRLRNITPQGFEFRRQGQELTPGVYGTQTISYIAWEPSSGMLGGLTFEVNSTDDVVRHDFHTILFDQPFVSIPLFLADMQTTDGGNTANLRWKNKDLYGVSVQIDEEQSKNRETNHTTEMVGYMAFAKKAP